MTYNYLILHFSTINKKDRKEAIRNLIEKLHFNEQSSDRLFELLSLELNHTIKTEGKSRYYEELKHTLEKEGDLFKKLKSSASTKDKKMRFTELRDSFSLNLRLDY